MGLRSRVAGLVPLLSFLFALVVGLLVDQALALKEILADLGTRWYWALHEGMLQDLLHGWPLVWVQGHHLLEEVFEVVRVNPSFQDF